MVGAWRQARGNQFHLAFGFLDIFGIKQPTRRQMGAAAVVAEFLVRTVNPKKK